MRNAKLGEAQAGIKIARRNINNFRYTDDTTLMAESKEELKSFLMKVKESKKFGLKLNIQKTKIMASVPSLHGKEMGKQWKQWDFIFLGAKITADGDCSHETAKSLQSCPTLCDPIDGSQSGSPVPGILQARTREWVAISFSRRSSRLRDWTWVSRIVGRCFTIWTTREVKPRQQIKKQRHYFANKGPLVKAVVFPIVMYGCECWTIKKAEHRRIDAFELWYWRRLLRVPWTARR